MRALVVLLGAGAAGSARADEVPPWDRYPDDDVVVESSRTRFEFRDDGLATVRMELIAVALTDEGRETLQDHGLDFNRAVRELVVDEACATDPRGERTCADLTQVVYEPEEGEPIVPGHYERIRVLVPMPQLQVGSRVTLKYHLEPAASHDLPYFGWVGAWHGLGPVEEVVAEVHHAPSRPVYGHLVGEATHERTEQDGRTVERWTFPPQPAAPRDRDRPRSSDLYPRLYLSEFDTWDGFMAWYGPHIDEAMDRFGKAGIREVTSLAEPQMSALDPVLRLAFLVHDRVPDTSVGLQRGTLLPGPMGTIVSRAGTETERAIALKALLEDAGTGGVNLALATYHRLEVPAAFPCPLAFQDIGVYVDGRGFIDPDDHPDFVDTIPSARRGGAIVVLDPEGVRVLVGEELDPPADRPGWHREGRISVSGGELRVDEELTFSGSAATAARSSFRDLQAELEDEEKLDKIVKRAYNRHFRKAPDETYAELAIREYAVDRGYASGRAREAAFFDPWDPEAETRVALRYAAEQSPEEIADLILVRPPFTIHGVSRRCTEESPDRDAPVRVSPWTYTYTYEFVIPDGYELFGTPADVEQETPFASLELRFREAMIEAGTTGDDGGDEEPGDPRPGLVIEAAYTIHLQRVALEDYPAFREVAASHTLGFTDPIVLRRARR